MTKPDRTKTPIGRGYIISFSWVMILSIVSAVLLPVREVQAQFNIGVWQPGGHTAGDKAFASSDVTDLSALGIDLLVDSTPRIESNPGTPTFVQDFEETIMGLWTGSNRRAAIYYEPENVSPGLLTLEHYAGRTNSINQTELNNKVLALLAKWGSSPYLPAFYGYRIGHEAAPNGYGIYNSATYGNLQQVINTIRAYDTARRIIAIGVVTDQQWASAARDSFVTYFFQPSTGGSPANILQNEYPCVPTLSETSCSGQLVSNRKGAGAR